MENDGFVNTIEELWAEMRLQGVIYLFLHPFIAHSFVGLGKPDIYSAEVRCTEVRSHNEDSIAEVNGAPLCVR